MCGALDECDAADRQAMAKKLRGSGQFTYLQRKVSPDEEQRIRELKLKGVAFLKESRRYYPNKELAAHVLGYVGLDNAGLGGLESAYDSQVRGSEGKLLVQTDARQQRVYSQVERPATAGATLELTIDQYLQFVAERELRAGVEENRRRGRLRGDHGSEHRRDPGDGQLPDVQSEHLRPGARGGVAATARSRTSTSRDRRSRSSPRRRRSKSTSSRPDDPIDTSPGRITFGSRVIRDTHQYGTLVVH